MKDSYKLAAVQMEIRDRKYPHDLLNDMKKLILEASTKNADVIVFPDYMDLNLLPYYITGSDYNLTDSGFSLRQSILEIFKSRSFFVKELIFTELINLARKYNIFICSGGWLDIKNNRFKKSIALISPSDGIVLEGESTHLFTWEYELNFIQGESLLFRKDVLGSIGILVGGEIYFPEVSRILNLLGVKILLTSNISKYSYNDFKYRVGIWREVQQNQVFACESFLLGNLGNDKLESRASVIGPCEITDDGSGIIAKASSSNKEGIIVAEVKISELEEIRRKYPINKFLNPDLYKKYLPNLYEKTG